MSAASKGASRDIRRYFPSTATGARPSLAQSESAEEEDPLSVAPSRLHLPELRPPRCFQNAATSTPSGRSRIAVVLTASPSTKPPSATSHRKHRAGDVTTDTERRLKRQFPVKKETPVPLPKIPSFPPLAATASLTPPSANNRGRPKGWKAGMSYAAMRGNDIAGKRRPGASPSGASSSGARVRHVRAKAPPAGFAKRRGRPQKPSSPEPCEIYHRLRPQYVDFLCEWAGCKAELHNLDTLRRHVYVVHGRGWDKSCRWGKCAKMEPAREFVDMKEFQDHVQRAHLVPFAWHIGDGPRNREPSKAANGAEIPDFLKDAQGNQVTPSIRDQEVEDLATWRMNRRRLKELLLKRDENLPDEDEDP